MNYGPRIKRWRLRRGLSREKLALKSGVGANYIYKLETGLIKTPNYAFVAKLAKALDVPVMELMEGSSDEREEPEPRDTYTLAEEVAPYFAGAEPKRIVHLLSTVRELPPESVARMLKIFDALVESEGGED